MPRVKADGEAKQQADSDLMLGGDADLIGLARLNTKGLRQLWRRLLGTKLPEGVSRPLTLRILAYEQQARRHGDLDRGSRKALADTLALSGTRSSELAGDAGAGWQSPVEAAPRSSPLRPGTVLGREYAGTMHRVMVMENGFSWNGKNYDSLSQVAFAITRTRWNGPRFFGLRIKDQGRGPKVIKAARSASQSARPRSPAAASASPAP